MAPSRLTLAVVARMSPEGVAAFQCYEARVLPLLAAHDGRLERRLRNADGTCEVHIVSFGSAAGFARFRADPARTAAAHLLAASGAALEVIEVTDVADGENPRITGMDGA